MQQEGVRANVEAVVEDLMLCVEERLWDEDKGRLVTASRELSRARTMIDDLESRVMVRDTSIAALQKEVQDGKQALTVRGWLPASSKASMRHAAEGTR